MRQDGLLGLLWPMWQIVIGVVVLGTVVVTAGRLARRGASRMNRALVLLASTVLGIAAVAVLFSLW
jgi:hypothetical protein